MSELLAAITELLGSSSSDTTLAAEQIHQTSVSRLLLVPCLRIMNEKAEWPKIYFAANADTCYGQAIAACMSSGEASNNLPVCVQSIEPAAFGWCWS